MGSPLDSSQFARLLLGNMREVSNNAFDEIPAMKEQLYRVINSESALEEFYQMGDVPDIPLFNGKLTTLNVFPGFHTQIEPKEFGAMLEFERKLTDDEKYGVIMTKVAGLGRSAGRTQEKYAVKPFNGAFSAAFDFQASEEGVALCSNSHTTKSGASTTNGFDNLNTSAFSKTALATARINMRQFRSDIGERIDLGNDLGIIHPDNLNDQVEELIGTPSGFDTAASDMNIAAKRGYTSIPYSRLDDNDTNNWFLVDRPKMKSSLVWINRIAPEPKSTVDFKTYILQHAIYFRIANGFIDWRWILGSQVS